MLQEAMVSATTDNDDACDGIAIVGMAGRFPGASNINEFWKNLMQGKDAQRQFTDEEIARNVPEEISKAEGFMRSGYPLEKSDVFDANFFGISPRQARLMDPQHRLFLECALEALEDAGYGSPEGRPTVGVYACSALSTYLLGLTEFLKPWNPSSYFEVLLGNDKDYLASRVCYKLGLEGPAVAVQSACSSSMLAIATACQNLQDFQTDIALAGGVNVEYPQEHGCICKEGDGFISPHGQCRAFDASASGIVQGNGLGIVVLKRLSDALEDRDNIYAVIRGVAVNNDGADKVGFTAPSVSGQRRVISEALYMADVPADSISYIETHGTGTALGDPIEITALASAYGAPWAAGRQCAIGSVKTNIGHLNTAAGVASVIKTALSLQNKSIPASLHFNHPNPAIPFEDTPFHVNTESTLWEGPLPRRAGVSSFGFGGTNVHMILEEAPAGATGSHRDKKLVLPVSAKTQEGLKKRLEMLFHHLKKNKELSLCDVAFTLQRGREAHAYRTALVCSDMKDAIGQLSNSIDKVTAASYAVERKCGFWFSDINADEGSGNEAALERLTNPAWAEIAEECALYASLYPVVQTALGGKLFVHIAEQICIARFMQSKDLMPDQVGATGAGGYAAAVLVGALSLRDALRLAARHAEWLQKNPAGTPKACADILRNELAKLDVEQAALPVFPIIDAESISPSAIDIDFWATLLASNSDIASPQMLSSADCQSSPFWIFCDGAESDGSFDQQGGMEHVVMTSQLISENDVEGLYLRLIAAMWQAGVHTNWNNTNFGLDDARRVSLPTYPFERQRFYNDSSVEHKEEVKEKNFAASSVTEWLHSPAWIRATPVVPPSSGTWLVFLPEGHQADQVAEELRIAGNTIVEVRHGRVFEKNANGYTVSVQPENTFEELFSALKDDAVSPDHILYLWHICEEQKEPEHMVTSMRDGATELAALARDAHGAVGAASLSVVTNNLFSVTGTELLQPHYALLAGPAGTIAAEYPRLNCRLIDVDSKLLETREHIHLLLSEAAADRGELLPGKHVALRDGQTWIRCFAPAPVAPSTKDALPLQRGGVYLITGGLGGMGMALAEHLAQAYAAKLVFTTKRSFPAKAQWADMLADKHTDSVLRGMLSKLIALEENDAELLVLRADAKDKENMRSVFEQAVEQFGVINGVIHAAGVSGNGLLENYPLPDSQSNFSPKVMGTIVLDELCREFVPDFVLLCSSLAVYGGLRGTADYISANAFMDAWAEKSREHGVKFISINWNTWNDIGMASALSATDAAGDTMNKEDGIKVCLMALALGRNRLAVCTRRIESLLYDAASQAEVIQPDATFTTSEQSVEEVDDELFRHPRPDIAESYVAPRNAVEQTLADIWAELLELEIVGVDDPFLDIGGDSLMALSLDTELRKIFPTKLPLNLVLNHGTVAKLAEYLFSDDENKEENLRIAELYQQVADLDGDELESQFAMIDGEG